MSTGLPQEPDYEKLKLDFNFCECGCKGSVAYCKPLDHFWRFHSRDGILVSRGHAYNPPFVGVFHTTEEADEACNEIYRKEMREHVTEIKKRFA